MATKSDIRTTLKNLVGRSFANIDTILNNFIDSAVELLGSTITSVYDEEIWEHTITQAEADAGTDNWALPSRTKFLLNASFVDESGSTPIYYHMDIVSPIDWFDLNELDTRFAFGGDAQYDYSSQIVFGGYRKRAVAGRVDYKGRPKFVTRINNNLFVFPIPGNGEVGKKLRILIAVKPAKLVNDTDSNTLTNNYPDAVIYYAGALFWLLHLNDPVRGTQWLNIASAFLKTFATEEEVKKLINIQVKL